MFKKPRQSFPALLRRQLLPRGGWLRASRYHLLRFGRIADTPRRVSRGAFAGTFIAFTPLFGIHFALAPLIAAAMRGNLLAAFAATLICNPVTFPFIAFASITCGALILQIFGISAASVSGVAVATDAARELWSNLGAAIGGRDADWTATALFLDRFILPYMIGGVCLGLLAGSLASRLSYRLVSAYRKRKLARQAKRNGAGQEETE